MPNMTHYARYQLFRKGHRGFSLIEVMVALVISMMLLAAMAALLIQNSNSHRELSKQSQLIENGTYAILKIGQELKHAGFYGLYSVRDTNDPAALPDPCVNSSTADYNNLLVQSLSLPIQGYNDPLAAPIGCIGSYKPETDVLIVRRVSTDFDMIVDDNNADTYPDNSDKLYLQSTGNGVVIDKGSKYSTNYPPVAPFDLMVNSNTPPDLVKDINIPPKAPTFEYFANIYYVSSCNNCDGGGDGIPTLYRAHLDENGLFRNEPLIDGIEQFQVEYGVDTDGNGAIDNFIADPTVAGDEGATIDAWRQVRAVRLYILARNLTPTNGGEYANAATYNLGAFGAYTPSAVDANDHYKRHLFTSTFQIMSLM